MSEPLVSIVIPVKNGARFLPQALADVGAQTYSNRELIVVDGRSHDGSAEIAGRAGARVVEQPGEGFADAWNLGVEAAQGSLLAFLDSDDRWHPEKLAKQVTILAERPDVDYVISRMRFFVEPGMSHPPGFKARVLESDHVGHMPSALLIRRRAFNSVGLFRTDLEIANDIEWFARVKDGGLVGSTIPEVLVRKRVHDSNLSYFQARRLRTELVGLLRESVVRQRTRG